MTVFLVPPRWLLVMVCVVAGASPAARADEPAEPEVDGQALAPGPVEDVLVPRGATWRLWSGEGVTAARAVAQASWAALEAARDRSIRAEARLEVEVPGGWPWPDAARGQLAPLPLGDATCRCPTPLPTPPGGRVAAVWLTRTFALSAVHQDVRVLDVRARYHDGLVVWINGIEVARRAIAGGAEVPAVRPHGPEWETLHIPVLPGLLVAGDNQIAIEVRPSVRRQVPSLDLEVVAVRASRIVRGPMIQRVGADRATVVVETDVVTDGRLEYGPTPARGQVATSPMRGTRHVFELTGLPARQAVHYQVFAGAAASAPGRFDTAPGPGETVRIAAYGDVRGGHVVHRRLLESMLGEAPDAIVATGDLVLRGSDEADWQRFFAVAGPALAQVPYYFAVGNHDLGRAGAAARRVDQIFALPAGPPDRPDGTFWASTAVGDVHLVFLDSNQYARDEQLAWLDADLSAARARGVRTIVAVTHDGPFSRGSHRGNRLAQAEVVPILVKHKVALLLAGHDHLYQRGFARGLHYIVTGGGGASLYAVSCGAPGKPRCKVDDGMRAIERAHHYVALTIGPRAIEACPRKADGAALEPCVRLPL